MIYEDRARNTSLTMLLVVFTIVFSVGFGFLCFNHTQNSQTAPGGAPLPIKAGSMANI